MRLRSDRKRERIAEGMERNEHWRSLSRDAKIAALDLRLGKGVGAKRQRAKLAKEK